MHRLLLVVLAVAPLAAQFENLATNDDGSVLYFSTKLRLRGTNQSGFFKSFVWDRQGVRLYLERGRQVLPSSPTWPLTNHYSVEAVDVAGDGSVVAVNGRRDCMGGSGCMSVTHWETEILVKGEMKTALTGVAAISRNGRYALVCCVAPSLYKVEIVDLHSGSRRVEDWQMSPRVGRRPISSTGVTALTRQGELTLFGIEFSRKVLTSEPVGSCLLDDAGVIAICGAASGILRIDTRLGIEEQIAKGSGLYPVSLDARGDTVLYASKTGLMVYRRADGSSRELASSWSGAVLSGDGRVVFAVTEPGELHRITLATGQTEVLIGPTAALDPIAGPDFPDAVAGSQFPISGTGFFEGMTVRLDGAPVPLISAAPTSARIQIPWNTQAGLHRLEIDPRETSIFVPNGSDIQVNSRSPQIEWRPSGWHRAAVAVHTAWDSLVTEARPAEQGEIIHLYATGLGPVDPPQADGVPAPVDRPVPAVEAPRCTFWRERPARVLFAGLAPGMIGLYQITLEVPSEVDVTDGWSQLFCGDSVEVPVRARGPG
jgi:uncharacterized protein (TIGR03437 family)